MAALILAEVKALKPICRQAFWLRKEGGDSGVRNDRARANVRHEG
jgi:hypothetical protein